ncbi:MAG: hypothetical protein ACOCUT_02360 [bacterium]
MAVAFSQSGEELIKQFDLKLYRPDQLGLKDFRVDLNIPSTTEKLKEQKIFGDLKKVIFQIYWQQPDKIDVHIIGMPKGFLEVKRQLQMQIASRIEYLIPVPLSEKLKGYKLETEKIKGDKVKVIAKDPTGKMEIQEYHLVFTNKGALQKFITFRPVGKEMSNFVLSTRSWSNNKWVIDGLNTTVKLPGGEINTSQTFEYLTDSGFGLIKKINIKMEQKINGKTAKEENRMIFSNYKINKGLAGKWFHEHESLH